MNKPTYKYLALLAFLFPALSISAQMPENYYSSADGKSGKSLKTALSMVINEHTVRTYKELWTDFYQTDVRADGKVWDMYSAITNYTFGTDQNSGSYKKEGDNYNREHSLPKSWFDAASPMYTDLFHLVPTDAYVNGKRGNLPFGEVKSPTWSSSGGFSKLGALGISGYSGTVFEPNDEYKGDFARIYFYMATRYEDLIASWESDMFSGDSYTAYASWALQMLLRWAEEDPVSKKEQERNEAVYAIQGNRNPFVDFPGLEQFVWGSRSDEAFYASGIDDVFADEPAGDVRVYDVFGRFVCSAPASGLGTLKMIPGIYVVNGKTMLVK